MDRTFLLRLPLGNCISSFNMEKAVCNHGFFMMAPNCWIPSTKSLHRPLRLSDSTTSVNVSISHPANGTFIVIHVYDTEFLSLADQKTILEQVARMLRITNKDENDLREFQQVHAEAKKRGFGRLFRSPTVFEDIIKSILLCNCTWERTLSMARALCELQAEITSANNKRTGKDGASCKPLEGKAKSSGNFPSSAEAAKMKENVLKEHCSIGYRARYIVQFARKVESGKVKLKEYEEEEGCYKEIYDSLMTNRGFGPFACCNILMCIGFYEKIPVDTETIRHLQEVHLRKSCSLGTVRRHVKEIYDKYAPFQCLAYWLELLDGYENIFGKLSELDNSSYQIVSRRKFK